MNERHDEPGKEDLGRPIAWTRDGRKLRYAEGIHLHEIVPSDEVRKRDGIKIEGEEQRPPGVALMYRCLHPIDGGHETSSDLKDYFPDETAAMSAGEAEIRALRKLDRRPLPSLDGHTPVFAFAPGTVATPWEAFRLEPKLAERIPATFRKPVDGDGYVVYEDIDTDIVKTFLPELFTPMEAAEADWILDEYPRLRALHDAAAPPTAHELLGAQLGLWNSGWDYDGMLRIASVGRPDADGRARVVFRVEENWFEELALFDVAKDDRIIMLIPASDLEKDDFSLDFERHEIVAYHPARRVADEAA